MAVPVGVGIWSFVTPVPLNSLCLANTTVPVELVENQPKSLTSFGLAVALRNSVATNAPPVLWK
jgi:hypothetical protein